MIEESGNGDESYDDMRKATDIMDILENLLAYIIYTMCVSTDHVRDTCEESYMNIKHQALKMMYDHLASEMPQTATE